MFASSPLFSLVVLSQVLLDVMESQEVSWFYCILRQLSLLSLSLHALITYSDGLLRRHDADGNSPSCPFLNNPLI
jgi:hypothetical protein